MTYNEKSIDPSHAYFDDLANLSVPQGYRPDEPTELLGKEKYSYARIKKGGSSDSLPIDQLSLFDISEVIPYEASIHIVAKQISEKLESSKPLDMKQARAMMTKAFSGSDTEGKWNWTDFYEAQEVAFIERLGGMNGKKLLGLPSYRAIWQLSEELERCMTHTKRTEEMIKLQQFSTPPPLAYLAALLAAPTREDLVLEPSAGTGLLAKCAEMHGAKLVLNDYSNRRAALLKTVFPGKPCYTFDGEQIHDFLPPGIKPTVVLINPPFSQTVDVAKRNPEATAKHVRSAFLRLAPGGRMVLLTAHWFSPTSHEHRDFFNSLNAEVQATAKVDGFFYYKHGTTITTCLTVIDKIPPTGKALREFNFEADTIALLDKANEQGGVPPIIKSFKAEDITEMLNSIPARSPIIVSSPAAAPSTSSLRPAARAITPATSSISTDSSTPAKKAQGKSQVIDASLPLSLLTEVIGVKYRPAQVESGGTLNALYEEYQPARIKIEGARPHPTKLCESAAMASVVPPMPSYEPLLPSRVLTHSILSFAQLESVVYAGEAHSKHLKGQYRVSDNLLDLSVAAISDPEAVRFRQGWF